MLELIGILFFNPTKTIDGLLKINFCSYFILENFIQTCLKQTQIPARCQDNLLEPYFLRSTISETAETRLQSLGIIRMA